MNNEVIAHNLKRLRANARYNQSDLAEKAGMSLSGYQKLERGKANPRADSLRSIAQALHVPIQELLTDIKLLKEIRFRSLKRLKTRDQVISDVATWLKDFSSLENLTGEHSIADLEEFYTFLDNNQSRSIPALAKFCREKFGLAEKEPVIDICGLLEARGIKVRSIEVETDSFLGLSVSSNEDGGPAVIVNTWKRLPVETWIFSAAHELGHLLMHLNAYDVEQTSEEEVQEVEADQFASHFLMPNEAFKREWDEAAGLNLVDRVFKVKKVFKVSWRTVLYRYSESLPSEKRGKLWMQFNIEYKNRYRRSLQKNLEPIGIGSDHYKLNHRYNTASEPFKLDLFDFKEDRLPYLVRKAVEGGDISLSRGAEILKLRSREMRQLASSWVD
jgi:Zn-dependent peptidase ImmA (M78 family)/DNA-binding XRE family transcriptional regulator